MAELITKKNGEVFWLLSKNKYPGVKDLHIHSHANGFTLTVVTDKGYKEHLDIDKYSTVEDFPVTLDYLYHKLVQKYGKYGL